MHVNYLYKQNVRILQIEEALEAKWKKEKEKENSGY